MPDSRKENKREKLARLRLENQETISDDKQYPNAIDMFLPSMDRNEVMLISPDRLVPYPDKKLRMKLYEGEKREDLYKSISQVGIIDPVIVTPLDDYNYTILAGHNRVNIANELGIDVKCVVRIGLTDLDKKLIVLDTNLYARSLEEMLPSELAHALNERNELLKERGKRNDLKNSTSSQDSENSTSSQSGNKLTTSEIIGKKYKLSRNNVFRYIRLVSLNDGLLEMVDNDTLFLNAGAELSYLKQLEQEQLLKIIQEKGYKISVPLAKKLKILSQETKSNIAIKNIVSEYFTEQKQSINFKFNTRTKKLVEEKIKSIVPTNDFDNIENILEQALKMYYSQN